MWLWPKIMCYCHTTFRVHSLGWTWDDLRMPPLLFLKICICWFSPINFSEKLWKSFKMNHLAWLELEIKDLTLNRIKTNTLHYKMQDSWGYKCVQEWKYKHVKQQIQINDQSGKFFLSLPHNITGFPSTAIIFSSVFYATCFFCKLFLFVPIS